MHITNENTVCISQHKGWELQKNPMLSRHSLL